jgi:hypothetical protein
MLDPIMRPVLLLMLLVGVIGAVDNESNSVKRILGIDLRFIDDNKKLGYIEVGNGTNNPITVISPLYIKVHIVTDANGNEIVPTSDSFVLINWAAESPVPISLPVGHHIAFPIAGFIYRERVGKLEAVKDWVKKDGYVIDKFIIEKDKINKSDIELVNVVVPLK